MSTSSLSSLPPSDFRSAPSSDTLDIPPPRPAPKRTYGRARPASPPPITELTSSSSFSSTFNPPVQTSPSKALLDRWSSANQSWRDDLSKLDAPSSDKQEEDEEAIRKEMERLRRQARGIVIRDQPTQIPQPKSINLGVPKAGLGATFSSSSLTSIPTTVQTSPPRSSPPFRSSPPPERRLHVQSSETENAEETMFPVRKSGMSGRPKRIIMSDAEESDEDEPPLFVRNTSTLRSRSPEDLSTTEKGSSPPPARPMSPASSNASADNYNDTRDKENMADFLDELAEDDARAEKEREQEKELEEPSKSHALDGLDDLFDDNDETPRNKKKHRQPRGLNRIDKAEMEKDIARAQRERPVAFSRPETTHLPISAWLQQANVAVKPKQSPEIKAAVPGLTFANSPKTSPSHLTPPDDDIIGFTPSSGLRHPLNTASTSKISIDNPNTPTPAPSRKDKGKHKVVVPGTSEGVEADEDEEQDFSTFMDHERVRDAEKADRAARKKRLDEIKQLALKQRDTILNLGSTNHSSENEDEFEIELEEEEIFPKQEPQGRIIGAKAVLSKSSGKPVISKQKQGYLARAGKLHKAKPQHDVSETYVEFAGKAFSHANQKQLNGGSKPAGQKKGREEVISQDAMERAIRMKHHQQVIALARKREEEFGRKRVLPQRVERDIEALVESTLDQEKEGSEDEDEDEDYNPEAEDEDGEERMVWSGEEAEEGSDEDEEGTEKSAKDGQGEKENEVKVTASIALDADDDDEDVTPMPKRKPRASARFAFDSDDEDAQSRIRSSPSVQRTPLAEVPAPQSTIKAAQEDGFGGFDLAGFGSGSGSQGGFSQLFDATQAGAQTGSEQDIFAALRAAEPIGLLPVNAMLPGVNISDTQVERDNNLIAVEIENAAMDRMHEMNRPKKQYINEKGLFTQTRPAVIYDEDTQISDSRRHLGGLSDFSVYGTAPFGKTQTQTQTQTDTPFRNNSTGILQPTPTQEDGTLFTRLRRRLSNPDEESLTLPLSPTQPAANLRPKNAFETLMSAAKKPAASSKGKMKSKMVDEQAEESDEDDGWGMNQGGNEEEDDEEEDGFVEGLVDDQEIDEEEKRKQDELAAAKNREIQAADDAKAEAAARAITAGEHRQKRKGRDFVDGDESSDDEKMSSKMRKRLRKKRKLAGADGLDKLDGEENVFKQAYEQDLMSDEDEVDETPYFSPERLNKSLVMDQHVDNSEREVSPPPIKRTFREVRDMIKQRAELNRGKTTEELFAEDADDDDLSLESHPRALKRRDTFVDNDDDDGDQVMVEQNGFSISRTVRTFTSISKSVDQNGIKPNRSLASYASYVQEESQVTRRVGGGASGVSVIRPQQSSRSVGGGAGQYPSRSNSLNCHNGRPPPIPHPHRSNTNNSNSSGSVLLSKGNKFA
ncbi:uncharacterized protein IL334_002907 [Kwoniella shivajii]|uniref:DNA replication checkpoint mediator MRC1 domain-containing protein n=1 Tax=Kwoniella shivajii TaxID=564305 RepID=A0ABZ1CWF1_9TREE|nr:hypothetical protein IL334_002907 [Kwoniella shivajii]